MSFHVPPTPVGQGLYVVSIQGEPTQVVCCVITCQKLEMKTSFFRYLKFCQTWTRQTFDNLFNN